MYDIIIIGGGLGGSTLANVMSKHGLRVLVLERTTEFKDRIRGEGMHAWGVPEAKKLGIYELLCDTCGIEVPWWDIYLIDEQLAHRNFPETTPHQSPLFSFYHPEMQETLLSAAENDGAEIKRAAQILAIQNGANPTVTVKQNGSTQELNARLVVGADGRNSAVRKFAKFDTKNDPQRRMFAGVLLEDVPLSEDMWYAVMNPKNGQETFLGSVGNGRVRAYLGYPIDQHDRFQTSDDLPRFIEESIRTGGDPSLYANAHAVGPLASFPSDDSWVEHPFKEGVALIGDAASTCDPAFGQGMALTLRGVRQLRDQLLNNDDWDVAGNAYAKDQNQDFMKIRTHEDWLRTLFLETGTEADERREKAFPLIAEDPSRMPDLFGLGPEAPVGDSVEKCFFGEE